MEITSMLRDNAIIVYTKLKYIFTIYLHILCNLYINIYIYIYIYNKNNDVVSSNLVRKGAR